MTLAAVVEDLEHRAAELEPGARLPSVRELMARHGVGRVPVQRAVALLAARELLEPRPGRGTFVAARPSAAVGARLRLADGRARPAHDLAGGLDELLRPPEPGVLVLSTGYLPADLQPLGALSQALARAARRPGAWDRMPLEGISSLRAWFAAQVGGGVGEGDVIVCLGGQAALAACLRGLAAPGAPVLVESPTYPGAMAAARAAGPAAATGAERRRRRAARPAGRGVRGQRRASGSTASRPTRTRTGPCSPASAAHECSRSRATRAPS